MQCQRPTWRAACRATNAYNPLLALQAAFGSFARRRNEDERMPSAWEPTEWEELKTNKSSRQGQREGLKANGLSVQEMHNSMSSEAKAVAPGQGVSKNARTRRRHSGRLNNAEGQAEDSTTKGEGIAITRECRAREILQRRAAQTHLKAQARGRASTGTADMSDPKYWHGQQYGDRVIDAEGWKSHIGNLVTLSRQMQEDKRNRREISTREQEQLKIAFDYSHIAILPREPAAEIGIRPPAPWELQLEDREVQSLRGKKLAMHWLNREILRFVKFMKPTTLELTARVAATKEVKCFIDDSLTRKLSADTKLEIHGSEKTGLAMSTSDIDIRIWAADSTTSKFDTYHYGQSMLRRMRPIYRALRSRPDLFGMVTRREGIHPIINFQHKPSGLDFQIVATDSSQPQEDATRKYLAEIPNLDDLFVMVRTFFEVRGLLPVHNGGIGSYGCFVMLLPPIARVRSLSFREFSTMTTANLLRRFLAFYTPSTTINPVKYGVSCFPRRKFKKHDADPQIGRFITSARLRGDLVRAGQWRLCQRNEYQHYLLSIQDPANPNNDLGSRMHAIKHILATIVRTREDLRQWARRVAAADDPSKAYEPILTKIVGRPDLLYKHQRQVLEDYGRSVQAKNTTSGKPQEQSERPELFDTKQSFDGKLVECHNVGAMNIAHENDDDKRLHVPEGASRVRKVVVLAPRIRTHSIGRWDDKIPERRE